MREARRGAIVVLTAFQGWASWQAVRAGLGMSNAGTCWKVGEQVSGRLGRSLGMVRMASLAAFDGVSRRRLPGVAELAANWSYVGVGFQWAGNPKLRSARPVQLASVHCGRCLLDTAPSALLGANVAAAVLPFRCGAVR